MKVTILCSAVSAENLSLVILMYVIIAALILFPLLQRVRKKYREKLEAQVLHEIPEPFEAVLGMNNLYQFYKNGRQLLNGKEFNKIFVLNIGLGTPGSDAVEKVLYHYFVLQKGDKITILTKTGRIICEDVEKDVTFYMRRQDKSVLVYSAYPNWGGILFEFAEKDEKECLHFWKENDGFFYELNGRLFT